MARTPCAALVDECRIKGSEIKPGTGGAPDTSGPLRSDGRGAHAKQRHHHPEPSYIFMSAVVKSSAWEALGSMYSPGLHCGRRSAGIRGAVPVTGGWLEPARTHASWGTNDGAEPTWLPSLGHGGKRGGWPWEIYAADHITDVAMHNSILHCYRIDWVDWDSKVQNRTDRMEQNGIESNRQCSIECSTI